MTLRRVMAAMVIACGLCVWGFARSGDDDPTPTESENRADAAKRYRANQSNHWRHVAVGNSSQSR